MAGAQPHHPDVASGMQPCPCADIQSVSESLGQAADPELQNALQCLLIFVKTVSSTVTLTSPFGDGTFSRCKLSEDPCSACQWVKTGYERLQSLAPWLRLVCYLPPINVIHLVDSSVIEQNKPGLETESLDVLLSTDAASLEDALLPPCSLVLVLWFCLRLKGVAYTKGYLELG